MDNIRNKFKEIYAKYFPNSYLGISTPALSTDGFMIVPLLAKDRYECANAIEHNDPFRVVGSVYPNDNGGFDFKLPLRISGLQPTEQYYHSSCTKVPNRKATGVSEEKLYEVFERHIKALRMEFERQRDSGNFLELPFDLNQK